MWSKPFFCNRGASAVPPINKRFLGNWKIISILPKKKEYKSLTLAMKKYIQTVFCTPETIQYSWDVKLHFSMWLCKKKLVHHSKKEKNTDTRATAVTKLLALKNDYLNNPKRKKHRTKTVKKNKQTNKNLKIVRARISKNKQEFSPSLSLQILYSQTLPKLKINYSRCFLSNPLWKNILHEA